LVGVEFAYLGDESELVACVDDAHERR
jgi:hypothetical protein